MTNDGAQLAMDVVERLAVRPSPNDVAWMDEVLLGWSRLPAGRSAIARALSELWHSQMSNQIARALTDPSFARNKGGGFNPPQIVQQADAIAGNAEFIREQDLVAALQNMSPNLFREQGIDGPRFVARVRELEGSGPALDQSVPPAVSDADALASTLIARLEAQEPLSNVLAGARRFAQLERLDAEAAWLHFEAVGVFDYPRRGAAFTPADRAGLVEYARLHASMDVDQVTADNLEELLLERGGPERSKLANLTVAELERWTPPPDVPEAMKEDRQIVEQWMRTKLFDKQVPSMLERIRHEVHRFLSEGQQQLRQRIRRLEVLGPEAEVVLDAGGALLDELRNAVTSLDSPSGLATAATQARTAILTMGRELYRGPKTHTSPISKQTFEIKNEKYMLRAYVDTLWERAPSDRRLLLEAAQAQIEEAYEIGSRAKNPFVISRDEAVRAVTSAYGAARAIALSNGFPLRGPAPAP